MGSSESASPAFKSPVDYSLADLIDIPLFQSLQDKLNEIYSFPSAIIDNEGAILTATAWQDICTKFHRVHPECERECKASDQFILTHLHEAKPAVTYRCPHGLVDNATPIVIAGRHLGNYFTGQFFLEPPDLEFFRAQARHYGFDEEAYLAAVRRVPVWSAAKLAQYLDFIKGFTEILAGIGHRQLLEVEARKASRHHDDLLTARMRLLEYAPAHTLEELLRAAIDEAERLTGSAVGFYHFVEENQRTVSLKAWSTRTVEQFCRVEGRALHYDIDEAGVWTDCLRERRPAVHNDYAALPNRRGLPEGHANVVRELVVPTFRGDRIVAILGVGNKAVDYGPADVETVSYLADVAWEIAERKRAEEERARLESQLQQTQRMESIGRLAGGIAHDFNNMLSVILGHTELALRGTTRREPLRADLEAVQEAALRSADLVRQLLTFARQQTVAPKVLDLNATVAATLKMIGRLIGEDVNLAWLPGADVWPVKIDSVQIDQILANLCLNARDAIAGVGRVTIETGNVTFDEEYCAVHAGFSPGDYALLAVSDDGCGMDAETLSRVFEPFFSTKQKGRGTGLGLATVYGAVRQNGGFINVYSEPGHGTCFKIYLPRHASGAAGEAQTLRPQAPASGTETILLVEDEPTILQLTARMLTVLGYGVMAARTPGEAIDLARGYSGRIDLVMTDVVMPDMNGRILTETLLAIRPDIKRLFMSGYTANVIAHRGVLDEGLHFIQKPFSLDALGTKIREALAGRPD